MNPISPLIRVCAWCKRVCIEGKWKLVYVPPGDEISHGICPDCAKEVNKEIDRIPEVAN